MTNSWQTLTVPLNLEKLINGLRIQASSGTGRTEIDYIHLKDSAGKIIRVWDFS